MNRKQLLLIGLFELAFLPFAQAANLYAGETTAATVCAQCHGIRTTSAEAPFPPLAGRDKRYLEMALKQYRDKIRISPIMNNIAGSLTDKKINDVVNYYSKLKP